MRPINSIVDISNYVMLEYGQPNHTYDLATVPGGAHPGSDGARRRDGRDPRRRDRTLAAGDGVIADGDDEAIGIAGVMGGPSTEISDTTTDVLLELAWWDPDDHRRTSTRLDLPSEASLRFEQGIDPRSRPSRPRRFARAPVRDLARTVVAPGRDRRRPHRARATPVLVRTRQVNAVLGTDLARTRSADLIDPIGFIVRAAGRRRPRA